jgi:hypothetical protein
MDNVREDLIRECVIIEAFQLEQLLTEGKVVELTVWDIREVMGGTEEQVNEKIQAFLEKYSDVFTTTSTMPPDRGEHNFKIRLVAGA